MTRPVTYKTSGVDIDKANRFVDGIKVMAKSTLNAGAISRPGSFGALFSFDARKYKQPVLVSSTDGVGTKLLIANLTGKHDKVGIDLVAMNVNDVLCTGAQPLFFLDYIACGQLDKRIFNNVMKGIVEGCRQAGCALIGGETAEMPGMYHGKDYDLAGFTVGVVESDKLLDGSMIKPGDQVIGLASSGIHSNGYSLVRKALSADQQKKYAKVLLTPTRIYVKPVLALLEKFQVHGMAHITGGAFYEKLTKVLPKGLCFSIRKGSWPVPDVFKLIREQGNVPEHDMYKTFNMGIGFAIVAAAKDVEKIRAFLHKQNEKSFVIGEVIQNAKQKIVFN
jgi:phosphoribosylformylglycinamidine cyclo-ligase